MQLGFIGLGKMGGNMVHRIHRDSEHECVVFDFNEGAVSADVQPMSADQFHARTGRWLGDQ